MPKKAAFHNLGCRVNAYETEAMLEQLKADGYEIVPFGTPADVCVVNTCTVTHIADRKSRQMLHRARELNPSAVVVAAGCYVEDAGEEILKDGTVDLIIGNHAKSQLSAILRLRESGETRAVYTEPIEAVREYEKIFISETEGRTRAFLKIQDGCNEFCSYCMIPYVRGRVRSRDADDIVKETAVLAAKGYAEIVLTGIHISSYGIDFDGRGSDSRLADAGEAKTNYRLLDLARRTAAVPGVKRIRFGSLEPGIMTEDFVRGLAEIPEICPQFHLSLQSGCDATLSRMKRHYSTAAYSEICGRLRAAFANPAITTDLIAGFPGETEEEFLATVEFVRSLHFAKTHVFKYSRRKGTRADKMPDQVPDHLKKTRSDVLIALDAESRHRYAESFTGKTVEVLFEEREAKDGLFINTGHTREALDAVLKGPEDLTGCVMQCHVREVLPDGTVSVEDSQGILAK